MENIIRNKAGLTLIETIVYLAIVSGFLVAIIGFSQRIIMARNKATTMQEVQQNARFAWDRLTQDFRSASSFEPDSTSSYIHLIVNSDDIFYQVSSSQLVRTTGTGGTSIALTGDQLEVENFIVTALNNSAYKIDLKIKYKNPNNWPEYDWSSDLSTTINIRNAQ